MRVFRLVSLGTIEQQIYGRQLYKLQLSKAALTDCEHRLLFNGVQGSKEEHGDLFGIQNLLDTASSASRKAFLSLMSKSSLQVAHDVSACTTSLRLQGHQVCASDTEKELLVTLEQGGAKLIMRNGTDLVLGQASIEAVRSRSASDFLLNRSESPISNSLETDCEDLSH